MVVKEKLQKLGYGFVPEEYLADGEDEYARRNEQAPSGREYRPLRPDEIRTLERNNNRSGNWADVLVTDSFRPEIVQNSKFYGLVRIGDMADSYLEYKDLRLPCGIYNSYVVSCDFGDTVAVHNVRYIAHFIVGNDAMLANIDEMGTSGTAKFGNGILKEGEAEEKRIRLELCNENGGRSVLPFDGMQAADVYLWSRRRDDALLQDRFREMAERPFSARRGFYSTVGEGCVIKNTHTIKDVKIGPHAYIKGATKLKNLTVHSATDCFTQIGESCELVNGIVGYGCRIFYGVKAVRFILSSFSQLKYGARLINSFLGDNSTISCCEVLNSLIFPAHEQHHNNSFLCAALLQGQSNMAAGATVGSNHNSRAADGEIVAGRGFWPGLCVSLKHNSRFASYTLIAKGDFPHELDIRFPFALVGNETHTDRLIVRPAYWFLHNMYALMRNAWKFASRDRRKFRNQHLEYDILAPDTVNEMFAALAEIEWAVGRSFGEKLSANAQRALGKTLMQAAQSLKNREILLAGAEFSTRKAVLAKPGEAYRAYVRMIRHYAAEQLLSFLENHSRDELLALLQGQKPERLPFANIGGQLVRADAVDELLNAIKTQKIRSWDEVHAAYREWSRRYPDEKLRHALASLAEITETQPAAWDEKFVDGIRSEAQSTREWIFSEIQRSRAKDYENPFRQMLYASPAEMEVVVGKLEDNAFIRAMREELFAHGSPRK